MQGGWRDTICPAIPLACVRLSKQSVRVILLVQEEPMATRRQTESPNKAEASRPARASPPAQASRPAQASQPAQATPVRPEPAKTAAPKRKAVVRKKAAAPGAKPAVQISEDARRGMIAEAAYLRAERRGFMPGNETEDWLAAEAEVDALLRAGPGGTPQ